MKKIPFTRLKMAQIQRIEILNLPIPVGNMIMNYMKTNKDFTGVSENVWPKDFFILSSVFTEMQEEMPNLPEETRIILENLNKQFISFDYLMII